MRMNSATLVELAMTHLATVLLAAERGDPDAAEKLLPLVYDELRALAAAKLAYEKPGQTLQATALVHEAFLRLIGPTSDLEPRRWPSRRYFFVAAAESMRRILVERARSKGRLKRGGTQKRVDLDSACVIADAPDELDLLALDEALTRLALIEPSKVELVKLRFFCGMTMPEVAEAMNISLATAERYWTFARSWLYAELK
jgi:RNA polymerase sigma factor (TIGR02999 family)